MTGFYSRIILLETLSSIPRNLVQEPLYRKRTGWYPSSGSDVQEKYLLAFQSDEKEACTEDG
jgi:hypothetical protein